MFLSNTQSADRPVELLGGAISSRVIKSKQHRERAAENRKRAAEAEALKNAEAAGVDHATGTNSAEDSATSPKSEKLEKKIRHSSGGSNKATPAKKFPFVGDMAFKITSKLHYSSSSNSPGLFTANPEFADPNMPFATSYAQPMEPKMSVVQKSVVSEPVVAPATPEAAPFDQPGDPTSPSSSSVAPRNLSPRPYQGDADDYMPYDAPVDSRKGSKASAMPLRQTSLMSTTESSYNVAPAPTTTKATTPEAPPTFATPSLPVQRPIADAYPEETQFPAAFMPRYIPDDDEDVPNDYAFMGVGVPVDNSLKGAIKETRTYVSDVSDSTESCFSAAKRPKRDPNADTYDSTEFRPSPTSAAEDPTHSQRAFSLGSKPFHKILPLVLQHGLIPTPQSNSNYIIDSSESGDIRKRAHSAGSKTWNFGLHRKMAADGQAGSNDLMRSRTGSMGTGTKRPFPRPTDHVEMDWSDGSKQGSIASLDSPNSRSRNSSMGMAMSANLRMAADNAKKSIVDKAAEKLAACKVEPRWEDFNFPPIGSPHFRQYTDRGNSGDANRRQSTPDEEDYVAISTTSGGNSAKKNVPRVINTILESDTSDSEMMPVVDQYALSPSGTPMPPVPMSTPIPTISPLPPPPTPALGSAKSNVIEYSFLVPTAEPSPTTRSTASSPLPAVQSFIPASPGNVSKTSADGRESSTVSDDGSTGGEAGSSGNGKKCEYAVLKMNDK
uniref:WH2 domain-containing protein n=1 Tax=Panagrellus redivivus TaxID=6233 RepID=A0A7E4VSK8_PANRE